MPITDDEKYTPDQFRFNKPEDYFIWRILGIGFASMIVEHPHQELDLPEVRPQQNENDYRRYIRANIILTGWLSSPWNEQISPPLPLLYPSAKHRDQYPYHEMGKPVLLKSLVNENVMIIDDRRFKERNGTDKFYDSRYERHEEGRALFKLTEDKGAKVGEYLRSSRFQFDRNPILWVRLSVDRVKYIQYLEQISMIGPLRSRGGVANSHWYLGELAKTQNLYI